MASLRLNYSFNVPGKRGVWIFCHHYRYKLSFSEAKIFKILRILLMNSSLKFCLHLLNDIYVQGFEQKSFNIVTPTSAKLCCVVCNLWHGALSCWKISPSSNYFSATECIWHYSSITFPISSQHLTFTPKLYHFCHFTFLCGLLTNSHSLECSSSFITEYYLISRIYIPLFIPLWSTSSCLQMLFGKWWFLSCNTLC